MYVRDHMRPAFHRGLGVDIDEYDMRVLRLTSEISKQCFPLALDFDNPALVEGLRRMERINQRAQAAAATGGIAGRIGKAFWGLAAGVNFLRLYMIPAVPNTLPATSRLQPIW